MEGDVLECGSKPCVLSNKDRDFWEGLKGWDVIVLSETWIEDKGWDRWKEKSPGGFVWGWQGATRVKRRGRAMGGMIM